MIIGAHESIAGGLTNALDAGVDDTCGAIQIFTKSSNQWRAKELTDADVAAWKARWAALGHPPVAVHDSYLINLASPDDALWEKSVAAFAEEIARCERLGIPHLIAHPGSPVGEGDDFAFSRIADGLNETLKRVGKGATMVLLENTAGQGSHVGWRFEHLAEIRALVRDKARVGVCFDTCHAFAAGYDLRTAKGTEAMWKEFESAAGLDLIKAFHLNDCKKDLSCRVDRHEHIGSGFIGADLFARLMRDERFANIPGFLETPGFFKDNLDALRALKGGKKPKLVAAGTSE
ncbi:MAG: deoxyribonuclease IV [Deltaproteobacteria bacterium]|nr:deoxyribonuclease IV [Deltaproteobacteria bacterium]